MAVIEEDDNWVCTTDIQQDLIKLHGTNKKKWHSKIATMIREHPSKFSILTVGVQDDGDLLYTFNEFCAHFKGTVDNSKLLQLIYDDMDHYDAEHIKFLAIHRWINEVKQQKVTTISKDHKWLFNKIQPVQAAHLDADGSGEVDRNEFVDYFVNEAGIDEQLANAIFNDIDINGDGDLSVMEYTKWKSKHNKAIKLKKFFKDNAIKKDKVKMVNVIKPKNIDSDDKKCENCIKLNEQIIELNDKYNQIELKFKSVNSKHTNLLQDYTKMSKLLEVEKNKKNKNGGNDVTLNASKENQQKLELLEKENKKLLEENKIRETEITNIKQQNKEFETEINELKEKNVSNKEKASKLEMNIKLKNEEIDGLKKELNENNDYKTSSINDKYNSLQRENDELSEENDKQNKKIKDFKKEINRLEEENDEYKININTKTEEIVLLKEKIDLNKSSDDGKVKLLRSENESLINDIDKKKKDIKRLKGEIEEEQENVQRIEKEKRKIKTALSKKDGDILILTHKLELVEQRKELETGSENDQINKLKRKNEELDDELTKECVNMKMLKEEIKNLSDDLEKERQDIINLRVLIDQEKHNTENVEKLKEIEMNKYNKEINKYKEEISSLNELLQKHDIEKEKEMSEKQKLADRLEKEKNNQEALIQQFDNLETSKSKTVESIQIELDSYKLKYKTLENKYEERENKQKEYVLNKDEEILQLKQGHDKLEKKVKTEKNHLDAVLRELDEIEHKTKEDNKNKVKKYAIKDKHDLNKLNIQIEILNSDVFRMKSLLLLSKYEKVDKKKYYGFLDFAEKDLSDKALSNVFNKLKVTNNKISASQLAPFLSVIVKLYMLRLQKMKTGKSINNNKNNENDRRIVEHFGVWLIRHFSKKINKTENISVLNDHNNIINGKYDIYDGYILKKEISTLFASWCTQYVHCNGLHKDSKLK